MYNECNTTKECYLSDSSKGAWSIEEIKQKSQQGSRGEWYNVKQSQLFPSIPLDPVVMDTLHLFPRISDNLINLLILEFCGHKKDIQ